MGVIHKLTPEVLSFIIENKQKNPALSCRQLTLTVLEQFQIKVSKSSINSIFKENNLSMPIGRRRKQKKLKFNMPDLPVIEGVKSVAVITPTKESRPSVINVVIKEESVKEEPVQEKPKLQEERINEAEVWAKQLQEEERIRIEKKRVLDDEAKTATNNQRLIDEENRLLKEKVAQEQALIAEKEKWARLAQEEQQAKHRELPKEIEPVKVQETVFKSLPQERACSGAVLLRGLDYLVGGSKEINELISKGIGGNLAENLNLTQALIFRSLFDKENFSSLGDLIGVQYSLEKVDSYAAQVNQLPEIGLELAKIIARIFTQVKGVRVNFADASVANLDAQLHSSWSTFWFPYNFSSPINDLKNNLNKYFFQEQRLVLFSAPGYDVLSKDFFSLISNMLSNIKPTSLTLFGSELNELETLTLNNDEKYSLAFGLWPWQFTSNRKVKRIGEFSLRKVKGISQDLYLGEIEIELLRLSANQSITLKGCAIKTNPIEKIRLVVLSTDEQPESLEDLAAAYLSRWPNFDEAFQDFSRKIELFTYAGNEKKFLTKDKFELNAELLKSKAPEIFASYIQMLDLYLRWHFFPADYMDKDISFTSKNFYNLPVMLAAVEDRVIARLQIGPTNPLLKDLEYCLRRLNERQIDLVDGARLCFESASK
ncbi:MAG: hypothetical protein WC543_00885 [Candidatus Omnitrophota bacterium]